jgi:hypothetical protein
MRMNSNTLKTTGAIVFSVLLMVAIVIYIPKPEPRSSKRHSSSKVVNTEYLSLAVQALSKANEASRIAHQKLLPLANEEKIDFSPLYTANTAAIDALAKADKLIQLCNEELQKFEKEEPSPTILIEANIKLSVALNEISETVKTLNREVQHLKKENAEPTPPSIKKVTEAITKLNNTIEIGSNALSETINAFREYYKLGSIGNR